MPPQQSHHTPDTPTTVSAAALVRSSDGLAALNEVAAAVSRATTLQGIHEAGLGGFQQALGADRTSLLLLDAQGRPRLVAWRGLSDNYRAAVEGHSPWLHDAQDPQPVLLPDIARGDVTPSQREAIAAEGIGAMAFVPLLDRGKLAGRFVLYYDRPHEFRVEEVRLAQAIANYIALALQRRHTESECLDLLKQGQDARAAAEEAVRLKDEFLATISHELRTPLNAMLGWTRLLRMGKLDAEASARALGTIERNMHVQAQLIEDLLDVSIIITGNLKLDVRPIELPSVIEAALDAVRPAASAKRVHLQALFDPTAGQLLGDPDRLQQVVWNLLSNAVKFTAEDGKVKLRVERIDPHLQITVRDTGAGIARERLPHVFDWFRHKSPGASRPRAGLGLGLAIVRHLVELHGGTVRADSDGEGLGATFTVKLPVTAVKMPTPGRVECLRPSIAADALNGVRVLIVDDEADARDLLCAVLTPYGAEVTAVASVAEALDAIDRDRPDVLVSDLALPGEDGYSLIRKIRGQETGTGTHLPAVALTAYGRPEDRSRALVAGFQLHVPKPVDPTELAIVVATLARRRPPDLEVGMPAVAQLLSSLEAPPEKPTAS